MHDPKLADLAAVFEAFPAGTRAVILAGEDGRCCAGPDLSELGSRDIPSRRAVKVAAPK